MGNAVDALWDEIVKVVRNGHPPDVDAVKAKFYFAVPTDYAPPVNVPVESAEAPAADNAG